MKKTLITTAICTFLSTGSASAQPYFEKTQTDIVDKWKTTAVKTQTGQQLVALLERCNNSIKQNPRNKEAYYERGYLLGTIGCTTWAIADLTKAVEIDPCYAAAYTERGNCYLDFKNYSLARADLDRAIYLNPRSGDARLARGKVMLELGKPAAALVDFSNAQNMPFAPALPGELPGNFYNASDYYLGVCNESLGRTDTALRYFKAAKSHAQRYAGTGYLHRYADKPTDAATRIAAYEPDS
jgi:tetratricopeptide (TPR) repeat protein